MMLSEQVRPFMRVRSKMFDLTVCMMAGTAPNEASPLSALVATLVRGFCPERFEMPETP